MTCWRRAILTLSKLIIILNSEQRFRNVSSAISWSKNIEFFRKVSIVISG